MGDQELEVSSDRGCDVIYHCNPCGIDITESDWKANGYACPYCSPRPKHALRAPVDVTLERANAVAAIGRAYDENREEKRARAAIENDNIQLRSTIASMETIISNMQQYIETYKVLVNEKQQRIKVWMILSWSAIIALLILAFK
jgi:DNA-directed RNA polymerase subunit RPC12/RpoP